MGIKKVSAVKKKLATVEDKISEVISRGGRTTIESKEIKDKEIRFTIRIPDRIAKQIDELRNERVGHISRNQWILEAVSHFVERK